MHWLKAELDSFTRPFGIYLAYQLDHSEYVGRGWFPAGLHDLYVYLTESNEYEPTHFEAAKYHPDTGDLHELSLRRIDACNPRWQWHIHCWSLPDRTGSFELYSHYELRPDPFPIDKESITTMINRLQEHYRPTYGETYRQGEHCDVITELSLDASNARS